MLMMMMILLPLLLLLLTKGRPGLPGVYAEHLRPQGSTDDGDVSVPGRGAEPSGPHRPLGAARGAQHEGRGLHLAEAVLHQRAAAAPQAC